MKKAILIAIIIVETLMGGLTYLVFDKKNSIALFSGGSIESTMKVFGPSFCIIFMLFLAITFSTVFFRKKMEVLLKLFLILFITWFICGRTIGVHWTGELITGWFYISTDKVILCETTENCVGDVIENITVKNSYLFRLKFFNGAGEKEIFAGPIIRSDLRSYFNKVGGVKN